MSDLELSTEGVQLPIEGFEEAYTPNPNDYDPSMFGRIFRLALAQGLIVRAEGLQKIENRTFNEKLRLGHAVHTARKLLAQATDGLEIE